MIVSSQQLLEELQLFGLNCDEALVEKCESLLLAQLWMLQWGNARIPPPKNKGLRGQPLGPER